MSAKLIVLALLVAGLGALALLPDAPEAPTPSRAPLALPNGLGPPNSCLPCHAEVVDEWRASMHSQAFSDPQVRAPEQADNFRKIECLPCHAPRPVFAFGIESGTRVLARGTRRHDGVDCLSCHDMGNGHLAARATHAGAACSPRAEPRLLDQALCAPCHDQHNLHQEWLGSPAAARGEDCISCHMQGVTRPESPGRAARDGFSHRFLGGRDAEFAQAGLELTATVDAEARALVVQLTNTFAAHNLPSDSRNRALDLVVTLRDARGLALPAIEGLGDRHPGGETGTARLRFRNPYRSSGDPSTQLPAGETAELIVPLPSEARHAQVELHYKLKPWDVDAEAQWSLKRALELPARD